MKAYLTRRYWLSAAHRLHTDRLSADENRAIYGKCNNPYGHGHNYAIEVTVSGRIDPSTGMVCDLVGLDATVQREIVERYDHQNLNCLPDFQDTVPTTENLCGRIYEILKRELRGGHLEKVRIEETSQNSFEVTDELPR